MKKIAIVLFLLATVFVASKTMAQTAAIVISDKTGWHKIATTKVDFEKETDEIFVTVADKFAKLCYHVTDAPIQLVDMDIYFHDGTMKTAPIGFTYKPEGMWSNVIDVPGGEKAIKKIVFRYKTLKNFDKAKAHLEIWGKKTNAK